jgi:hypothetical protein
MPGLSAVEACEAPEVMSRSGRAAILGVTDLLGAGLATQQTF